MLALMLSLGAHWAFLQSVAWAGMLYTYSQQAGFTRAVSMTFDGDHPCALCKGIQKSRNEQQPESPKIPAPSDELKLDLPPLKCAFIHPPRPAPLWAPVPNPSFLIPAPELPPPRCG